MKHFTPKKFIGVSLDEINEALEYCKKYRRIVYGAKPDGEPAGLKAWIEDKEVEFCLTYRRGSKVATYVFRKDGEEFSPRSGIEAFRILNKYYKVPHAKFPTTGKQYSASGYLYFNKYYNNARHKNCYGYDINSAYPAAMCKDMPDTTVEPKIAKRLEEGEIGFTTDYKITTEVGKFCIYVYPRIKSPFVKFATTRYNKKKKAQTRETKQYAKAILNCAIGYLQRVNPVLRTAILSYANQYIQSMVDENTLYCNTDSIVSRKRRDDIEEFLGEGLGEWKIEHEGSFAYKNFTCQWNLDLPTYRGIPKSWFKEGWDVLKDTVPDNKNIYEFTDDITIIRRA